MNTKIFVNLPIKDLSATMEFFTKLGFKFNAQFTDEKAACMIVSDNIYIMLVTEKFFQTFIKKKICDAQKSTEVLLALSAESRTKVDEMLDKVIKAGGKEPRAAQDHGWMYGRSFEDINGHIWEIIWMDESKIEK